MTNKQAIKGLKDLLRWYLKEEPMSETVYKREAVSMAISALSTEGEYIKKSELLQHVTTEELSDYKDCDVIHAEEIDKLTTYSFPDSAENKGAWIDYTWYDKDLQSTRWGIKCNKCNKEYPHFANLSRDFHYCPNCGADMRGSDNE